MQFSRNVNLSQSIVNKYTAQWVVSGRVKFFLLLLDSQLRSKPFQGSLSEQMSLPFIIDENLDSIVAHWVSSRVGMGGVVLLL